MGCKVQTPSHKSPVTQSSHSSLPALLPTPMGSILGSYSKRPTSELYEEVDEFCVAPLARRLFGEAFSLQGILTYWRLGMAGAKPQNPANISKENTQSKESIISSRSQFLVK